MGIGIAPWGFWGFWNPIRHFFTFLLVSPTYWESVPYKKSRDGDYGDLSNPIWHFLHFSFLLVGKSYILIISTLREITGWGTWGYEKSPWTCFKCDVAFFFLLFGKYYTLGISSLYGNNGMGIWDFPMGIWGFWKSPWTFFCVILHFFFFPFCKSYILGFSTLQGNRGMGIWDFSMGILLPRNPILFPF